MVVPFLHSKQQCVQVPVALCCVLSSSVLAYILTNTWYIVAKWRTRLSVLLLSHSNSREVVKVTHTHTCAHTHTGFSSGSVVNTPTSTQTHTHGILRWFRGKETTCQCRRHGFYSWSEDPLEKELKTHSSILAWKIPWTKEPGGL